MRELRILHLVPNFTGGGAERQLAYLAAAQVELGLEVHVAYVRGGPNLRNIMGSGVRLHELQAAGNHDARLLLRINRLIDVVRPAVMHTWLTQMDILGGLVALYRGVPWVLSERSSGEAYRKGWKSRVRKWLGKRATAVVANSAVGLEYWGDLPENVRKLSIRNIVPLRGIDEAQPHVVDDSEELLAAEQIILAAGRLDAEKNWPALVDALNLALKSRPKAHAVIFGDGILRQAIVAQVARLEHARRIHLRPHTNALWSWLKRSSLYVSISHFEGASNILLEAIACRCPVVLSDIPGHREIASELEAIYVSSSAPDDVAAAIVRSLSGNSHPRVEGGAYDLVRRSSADLVATDYVRLYRELVHHD